HYCPYCRAAKSLLNSKNISFEEISVEGDDAKRQWLMKETGQRTVPQIFINNQSIGGYQELAELDRNGELKKLISS
ncbi:MAG: glutaredoxin 3, partial [Bacteroidales bacterium]|nr:glutaredoxin 3 [Bacteroidales bacterium]